MRGTERVNSPAPLYGALRGVPAEGVDGDGAAAPAQGKAFPKKTKREIGLECKTATLPWNDALSFEA